VNGDIRLFTDSHLELGAALTVDVSEDEGGLASVREGRVRVDGEDLGARTTLLVPPGAGSRSLRLEAVERSRVVRVVHGPGEGFARGRPMMRRSG
jgi:hypothetical protein